MESIYNIKALIDKLEEINKEEGNIEVYVQDNYSTGEYLRISGIWIDRDNDVIIDINKN